MRGRGRRRWRGGQRRVHHRLLGGVSGQHHRLCGQQGRPGVRRAAGRGPDLRSPGYRLLLRPGPADQVCPGPPRQRRPPHRGHHLPAGAGARAHPGLLPHHRREARGRGGEGRRYLPGPGTGEGVLPHRRHRGPGHRERDRRQPHLPGQGREGPHRGRAGPGPVRPRDPGLPLHHPGGRHHGERGPDLRHGPPAAGGAQRRRGPGDRGHRHRHCRPGRDPGRDRRHRRRARGP